MSIPLRDIASCFEGEIPSMIATCSSDGVPNLGHLSHVYLIDDHHVAASNQFFTKTVANLEANPLACIVCLDPRTLNSYRLTAERIRSERDGPNFEKVRRSIDAIAVLTNMADVFELRALEVFRVLHVEAAPSRGLGQDG